MGESQAGQQVSSYTLKLDYSLSHYFANTAAFIANTLLAHLLIHAGLVVLFQQHIYYEWHCGTSTGTTIDDFRNTVGPTVVLQEPLADLERFTCRCCPPTA